MAWAYVQSTTAAATGAATGAITTPSSVSAGSLIVVFTGDGNTADTLTCSKTAGTSTIGAVTTFGTATDGTSASQVAGFWCVVNSSGTLTMTVAGGSNGGIQQRAIAEYSGGSTAPNDSTPAGQNGTAGSATANADTAPTVTPSVTNDIVIAWIWDDQNGGANTYSAGTSPAAFTQDEKSNVQCVEHFVNVGSSAVQPTFTGSGTDRYMSIAGAFKLAGAATTVISLLQWGHGR